MSRSVTCAWRGIHHNLVRGHCQPFSTVSSDTVIATQATNTSKLDHRVRELARILNMVPALSNQSLLSRGKFAEVGYVPVCDVDEVKIYNGNL